MTSTTPTIWKSIDQVNTTDSGMGGDEQNDASIVALANGGFIVVWEDESGDGSNAEPGAKGQILDALGNNVGEEFALGSSFQDFWINPVEISALPDGGFAIAYRRMDPVSTGLAIVVLKYNAGSNAPVRQDDFWNVGVNHDIATFTDGSYVLLYKSAAKVVGYLVSSTGTASTEFTIGTVMGDAGEPRVAALAGSLNRAYVTVYADSATGDIQVVLRDEAGAVSASGGVASSGTANANANVAALEGGGFVVVWQDGNGDGAGNTGIRARIYSNAGVALGESFSANVTTAIGVQDKPVVTALSDGGFVVVWQNGGGFKGQAFTAAGLVVGSEFSVAAPAGSTLSDPQLSMLRDGRFVMSYTITETSSSDADVGTIIWDPRSSPVVGTSENDFLTGLHTGTTIQGLGGSDTLYGLAGNDILEGGAGADTLVGGGGPDMLVGGDAGGIDTASFAGSDAGVSVNLATNIHSGGHATGDILNGIENLTGSTHADKLIGNSFANTLDGGGGSDTLIGMEGNDTYVTDGGDLIGELASQGTDTVRSSVSFSLGSNLENLTLTGTVAINGYGNALANLVSGNSAANVLDGKTGADRLQGGLGDDTYITDGGDIIVEALDQGTDTVRSSVSFALGSNLENLVLTGSVAIIAIGNSLANTLSGNVAANLLDGGTGLDRLFGGSGNDSYITDGGDLIVEAANQGTDGVRSSANCTLAANVENLMLTGTAAISGLGNSLANTIVGNSSANVLNGGLGNDILTGSIGNDAFLFNTTLGASTNVDRITDFDIPADTIRLDNAVMPGLGAPLGTLAAGKFWASTSGLAHDADDRIVYDMDSGRLFYDPNGSAAGGAVHFATVSANLALTNADFVIV